MSTQARTRLARRAVIEAARELFSGGGYAQTTVRAISAASDVPPATVYRLFSSKRGILKALIDVSIAGDDEPTALAQRGDVQALLDDPNPESVLAGLVRVAVAVNHRTAGIYQLLVDAAASDPQAATLLTELTHQRHRGQGLVAHALASRGALRPPLRESDARDIIHALVSPEMYRLLMIDRGWTQPKFEKWLTATLAQQLLAAPVTN